MKSLITLPRALFLLCYKKINPLGFARFIGVTIGSDCRLINVDFGSEPYLVSIGNHFSGTNVSFVTHDGGVWIFRTEYPELDVIAPIQVGNNVFLGTGVTILPGVTIGDNVVVGAGSVVTRSIPSDCVAAGIPARPLGHISDYKSKCLAKGKLTKHLSARVKRDFYEKYFKQRD